MSREDPQMKIRLPEALKARIEQSAEAAGRSMNSEIIARLQATYDETVVTTVEARVKPGAEEKRFEFNADEIADKVVERLEGRNKRKAAPNKVIIPGGYTLSPEARSDFLNLYASMIGGRSTVNSVILGSPEPEVKPRGNDPYGPRKSQNAPKSLPKKPRGKKA
jgi:hypothetical protein